MPKNKKQESSDSDSGPDDRNTTAPAKKSKTETPAAKKSFTTSASGEMKWALDRDRFVTVSEFKGSKNIQIREYYLDKGSQEMRPGKKGISLKPGEFKKLLAIADEINKAVES